MHFLSKKFGVLEKSYTFAPPLENGTRDKANLV